MVQPLISFAGVWLLHAAWNKLVLRVCVSARRRARGSRAPQPLGCGYASYDSRCTWILLHTFVLIGNCHPPGLRARGVEGNQIPPQHALTVTVPGAAALWDDCVSKFGKLSLKQVLQPAIELAESGFPVSPVTAYHWQQGLPLLRAAAAAGGAAAATSALMTPSGGAPTAGELFRNPDLAATFRAVAERGAREGFYRGRIAEAIVTALRERGGVLSAQDLEEHATRVVEPISTTYKGERTGKAQGGAVPLPCRVCPPAALSGCSACSSCASVGTCLSRLTTHASPAIP